MGPVESSISDGEGVVLNAQNHRLGLGPIKTCNSGAKVAVLYAKTIGDVWDQ